MNHIKIPNNDNLEKIADSFLRGALVAYPTETIYGLGCDATNELSIRKIFKAKNRDKNKPIITLVRSYCMLRKYFFVSQKQINLLKKMWTPLHRPVTVILKPRSILPKELIAKDSGSAVRMPVKCELLLALIKKINRPITSTSLNKSGEPAITTIKNIPNSLSKYIELAIDSGTLNKNASKILDIRDINNIKTIRN